MMEKAMKINLKSIIKIAVQAAPVVLPAIAALKQAIENEKAEQKPRH